MSGRQTIAVWTKRGGMCHTTAISGVTELSLQDVFKRLVSVKEELSAKYAHKLLNQENSNVQFNFQYENESCTA